MYETIMELPLFKGIGAEQLSIMLEKTKIVFLNFDHDETIIEKNTPVKHVDFILSGNVNQCYRLENFDISIRESLGKYAVIGALNLFGLETVYPADCIAQCKTSILRISKEQYVNILMSDKIYLYNYLNFLSAAVQRPKKRINNTYGISILERITDLAYTFASPMAETIEILSTEMELARYCGISINDFKSWKGSLVLPKQIEFKENGIIIKKSIS